MKKLVLFNLLLLSATASWSQAKKEQVLITDMLKIQRAGQLDISPDMKKLIFTVQKIQPKSSDSTNFEYDTQLWLADLGKETPYRQLTFGKDNPVQPSFSPDGQSILFIRRVEGKNQFFLMPLNGGEAQQLTKFKYGVGMPKWSPDGKKVIFTVSIKINEFIADARLNSGNALPLWASEKPGFKQNDYLNSNKAKSDPNGDLAQIRAYLTKNESDQKAKVINKLQFQGESATSSEMQVNHVFLLDLAAKTEPQLITSGYNSYQDPYFINNNEIMVNARLEEAIHPDRSQESAIYRISLLTREMQMVQGKKEHSYRIGSVSPSGKYLVFGESETGKPSVAKVRIQDLASNKVLSTIPLDRNLNGFKWTPKEDVLYFTAQSNGGVPLYRTVVKGGPVSKLSDESEGVEDFVLGEKAIIYSKTSVSNPSELEIADEQMKHKKVITTLNSGWLAQKNIVMPEKHTFKNELGMEVEYWVMKPANYQPGQKYPLLLEIHGGPSAMWGPGEAGMWHEYQYFCAMGYGVVYSNPRGSGGYGEQFLRGNVNNWGEGPMNDVIGALDRTVAEGWADTSKLVVTGGSYAGYLVSWIVAHDQRFKAACAQRGVFDLKTFFGEGNAWRLVPNYFGGYPWEEAPAKIIERESPINYVANIRTPLIIFHGENDLRTGVIQSEMLYKSLKVLNRPVEYVRHPGATHEITRSGDNRQRIDQMLRTYEFFERFIR